MTCRFSAVLSVSGCLLRHAPAVAALLLETVNRTAHKLARWVRSFEVRWKYDERMTGYKGKEILDCAGRRVFEGADASCSSLLLIKIDFQ